MPLPVMPVISDHCSKALKFQKQKTKAIASDIQGWTNTAEQKIKI